MSITEWILVYLAIGAAWSWGTNDYCQEPTCKHDFVMSMALWPVEVFILIVSYIPIAWEEAQDKIEEWKAKLKK